MSESEWERTQRLTRETQAHWKAFKDELRMTLYAMIFMCVIIWAFALPILFVVLKSWLT